jgi:hypothetical protein
LVHIIGSSLVSRQFSTAVVDDGGDDDEDGAEAEEKDDDDAAGGIHEATDKADFENRISSIEDALLGGAKRLFGTLHTVHFNNLCWLICPQPRHCHGLCVMFLPLYGLWISGRLCRFFALGGPTGMGTVIFLCCLFID